MFTGPVRPVYWPEAIFGIFLLAWGQRFTVSAKPCDTLDSLAIREAISCEREWAVSGGTLDRPAIRAGPGFKCKDTVSRAVDIDGDHAQLMSLQCVAQF